MTRSLDHLRDDLGAEQVALDDVVALITDEQWRRETPSPGWNVADQIAHLAYFDAAAARAIVDPERFRADREELIAHAMCEGVDSFTLEPLRRLEPRALLQQWRAARSDLDRAARTLGERVRVEWFGPSMSAASFLRARLMETWAHGTDVVDALGTIRRQTDRLVHVAELGYRTRAWSYQVRGESVPEGNVRLELVSPSGALWAWGPDVADDTISGAVEEFCFVVTQRRHVEDTSLRFGELGGHWLERAQAFAGAATSGPAKGSP